MKKTIKVAKGVKVKRGQEEKMRSKKGSSSAGKYKDVSPKEFAGKSGGASKYSFPINTLARARNALARAHYAPHPEGIRSAAYKKYPELKHNYEKRHADPKKKRSVKSKSGKAKVEKVMREYKHGELHSGSNKGPRVKNRKQAIAIALSEARKAKK